MFGNSRRTLGGPQNAAVTPRKRMTDFGPASSARKGADSRLSMGQNSGQPRLSIFARSSAVPPRDVKAMMAANVAKIHNFLIEHEGADAPPEETIRNPRGKNDFISIFEQIYQHLSKEFEFPVNVRLEDRIPQIFKGLAYPVTLKNSYFQPMGSSHGYPHLVDALAWLVDFVRINACVAADTQNIIFGDLMEPTKVHEKTLSYAWLTTTFKDYTQDRKAIDSPGFWLETKNKLRKFFEESDDIEDATACAKNSLEQLRFECEEIEADKGNEQSILDDIARLKDDIRKATEYLNSTEMVKKHNEKELASVKAILESKLLEIAKWKSEVNELKARIEEQKEKHGLSGKEVRLLNSENEKDKEVVAEIQAELEALSKQLWRLKNVGNFKTLKSQSAQFIESIEKLVAGAGINVHLKPLRPPADESELEALTETLNTVWLPEINRLLQAKMLELESSQLKTSTKQKTVREHIEIEKEYLREAEKREAREERRKLAETDAWKEERLKSQTRFDELENRKDLLRRQMQLDASLEKEIEEEKAKARAVEQQFLERKTALESAIRHKLDAIVTECTDIEKENMMCYVACNELEKVVIKETRP